MRFLKKIQYNSPVVLTFAGLSLIALILGYITGGATNTLLFSVYRSSPLNPLTYVRLFCHVLGHSGYQHYIGNMLMILVIGPVLDDNRPGIRFGAGHLLPGYRHSRRKRHCVYDDCAEFFGGG